MKPLLLSICFLTVVWCRAQMPIMSSYPTAPSTILLDFDGHTVEGTSWNYSGTIQCGPSGLSSQQIIEIFNRVAEDYRPFNINITTDSLKYLGTPLDKRLRIIITTTSQWYGSAGGVAFVGSFTWGDDTPCFVFSQLLQFNTKYISEACSHEAGHTLGLYHQSTYDTGCTKLSDYNYGTGTGEIGWAPIMGIGYYKNFTVWHNGPNSFGCDNYQYDKATIINTLGSSAIRPDDYSNTFETAFQLAFTSNLFSATGLIETETDWDLFKFTLAQTGHLTIEARPFSIGTNNSGSDLDINLSLFNEARELINSYNLPFSLNSVLDTILSVGNYYIQINGGSSSNASNYGSLGNYSINGTLSSVVLPLHKLILSGSKLPNGTHELNWIIEADEPVLKQQLQVSLDGINYYEHLSILPQNRKYIYNPTFVPAYYYQLKILLDNGNNYLSNIISLNNTARKSQPPYLVSNIITTHCQVISPEGFSFLVYSPAGELVSSGFMQKGLNDIHIPTTKKGLLFIVFTDQTNLYTQKLLLR